MTRHQNKSASRPWLQTLSRIPVMVLAVLLVTSTSAAMADSRFDNRGPRFNNSWNSSFNRDSRYSVNRHVDRNHAWNRSANRFSNRAWNNRFYDNRYRFRNNRDNWSVSQNLGTGYSSWYGRNFYNNSFYTGLGGLYYGTSVWNNRYGPRRNNTTVIYTQPKVVYVNDSSRASGHEYSSKVIRSSTSRAGQRSLLRDIHGDCYERSYDSQGRETRIQLPDSACNF